MNAISGFCAQLNTFNNQIANTLENDTLTAAGVQIGHAAVSGLAGRIVFGSNRAVAAMSLASMASARGLAYIEEKVCGTVSDIPLNEFKPLMQGFNKTVEWVSSNVFNDANVGAAKSFTRDCATGLQNLVESAKEGAQSLFEQGQAALNAHTSPDTVAAKEAKPAKSEPKVELKKEPKAEL